MDSTNVPGVMRLADSDLTVADPDQDVRGRTVKDGDGEEIGKVKSLFVDEQEGKVRFLEIESGDFFGFGGKTRLVPVDAVRTVDDDTVHLHATRQHVHGSPAYDPDLVDAKTHYQDLYDYYGYAPYWAAGHVYPPYPYHRERSDDARA